MTVYIYNSFIYLLVLIIKLCESKSSIVQTLIIVVTTQTFNVVVSNALNFHYRTTPLNYILDYVKILNKCY